MSKPYVLVVYYSRHGATESMARLIADGIDQTQGMHAKIKTVPPVMTEPTERLRQPDNGPGYVETEDLLECQGLIMGSPAYFGNMAAPLKHFIDTTSDVWLSGGLIGKPAAVFTSASTMHGGHESTLMSMMLPLMHHGAYLVGVPYSQAALNKTITGGSPYGPSHVSGLKHEQTISEDEKQICISLGKRVAELAWALNR